MDKPEITTDEFELLGQETELLAKKEEGQNLDKNDEETLTKIETLKGEINERFKGEENPANASLQAQKEHFRNKFNKLAEEHEKYKTDNPVAEEKKPEEKKPEEETKPEGKDFQERTEFLLANRDVTKEQMDFISAWARGKGVSLEDAYTSDEVKLYLEAKKSKVAEEEETPESTYRAPTVNKKPLSELTEEELKNPGTYQEVQKKAVQAGKEKRLRI